MSKVSESLIWEVFNEMVRHKASLGRHLMVDEDEDEEVDVRILADQVIKNFPWPIGVELRRLFSGSMREPDRGRLDQLFKTIERTMQFISFVMVIELYQRLDNYQLSVHEEFSRQFRQRFMQLSMGNFTWLIRAIGNLFQKNNVEFFMPEMSGICHKKFFDALDFWVPERNEIGHYQINLNDEEIQRRCVEYQDKLAFILKNIAFLIKYRLVTVREIKVLKNRNRAPQFEHLIDILNSSDSDFYSKEQVFDTYSDSNAVLLMRSLKAPADFLNLSPLIIDTRTETIDSKEKYNLKKDIFMYTRFYGGKIFHIGTEVTERCDLSMLSNYQQLIDEFEDLLRKIDQEGVMAVDE
jgi:hypothetical protein